MKLKNILNMLSIEIEFIILDYSMVTYNAFTLKERGRVDLYPTFEDFTQGVVDTGGNFAYLKLKSIEVYLSPFPVNKH